MAFNNSKSRSPKSRPNSTSGFRAERSTSIGSGSRYGGFGNRPVPVPRQKGEYSAAASFLSQNSYASNNSSSAAHAPRGARPSQARPYSESSPRRSSDGFGGGSSRFGGQSSSQSRGRGYAGGGSSSYSGGSSGGHSSGGYSGGQGGYSSGGYSSGGGGYAGRFRGGSSSRGGFSPYSQPRNGRRGGKRMGEHIDISRFVKKAVDQKPQPAPVIDHVFADFNFPDKIQSNLAQKNYVTPTPIQDKAIPFVQAGKDVVGMAQTGTGKTAAFLLPLIQKVLDDKTDKQNVLIIAPTRELAQQIEAEFRQFTVGLPISSTVCVGGMPIFRQIASLRQCPHFVIGTPGRLKDLADKKCLKLAAFNSVVIDEVDHMLDMGFIDDIKEILSQVSPVRQSLFFSATMPPRIRELVNQFLKDPVTVEIQSGKTAENVDQDIVRVTDKANKFSQLTGLLSQPGFERVIVFSETKRDVERLTMDLINAGFKAQSIHGDKQQRERTRALEQFKTGVVSILVATDVAARGIDVKDVSHVINYTIPQTHDDYVHRIGRTGRGNKKGIALTFV